MPTRVFATLVLLLVSTAAFAKPCQGPAITSGYGASFPQGKQVSGFSYDYVNEIMYPVIPNLNQYYTYLNVPNSVGYGFANAKTPDTFYTQQINRRYYKALETENCFALLTENGKFLVVTPR